MKLSFRNRMLVTISAACTICTVSAIFVTSRKLEKNGIDSLAEKSRAILSRLEVGAAYVANMGTLEGVIEETVKKFPDGQVPGEQKLKVLKSVPIFAAFKIGETGAAQEHYQFRIAADVPRNKDHLASPEERTIIEKFRADPNLKELVEISPDGNSIRLSRPVRLAEASGCLSCHGDPSHSPWKNGKDVLGFPMENMKDGHLQGTFTIVSSLEPVHESVMTSTRDLTLWGILMMVVGLFCGYLVIRRPIDGINLIADHLLTAADGVALMSTQIATTSEQLSSGATQQAAALQQTSASMEEVRAMVAKNSENAEKSTSSAVESQSAADKGKVAVQDMIQSIGEIDQSNNKIMKQIEESNRQISEIVKVISDIGTKTKVINDIVFQTKLLSFNASVEAARAGEHGKGFAVVAEEVGNLAQMSGNAAAEITEMLDGSIQKVEAIVTQTKSQVEALVREGKGKVEAGTLIARRCGEVLNEIVSGAHNVNQLVAEISVGSQEQAKGVDEISKAVVQLNQVTQQNATSSEESANAADRLSKQADTLRASVELLRKTLSGDAQGTSPIAMQKQSGSQGSPSQPATAPRRAEPQAKATAPKRAQPQRSAPAARASHEENHKNSGPAKKEIGVPSESDPRFEDI